jgi:hypothetical protein
MLDPKTVLFAISIKEIVEVCGVDVTTARRWKRGAICPPQHALLYLQAKVNQDLSFLDPAWRGWVLRHGHLISPEGWQMSMSDVLASRLHEAQLAAWRIEVRKLKAELAGAELARLEEQPTVDQWDLEILAG